MQAPDCVGQVECAADEALRIARCCGSVGSELALRPTATFAENAPEAVEPVAFEPDWHRARGQCSAKSQAGQFRPTHGGAKGLGYQHIEPIRLRRLDSGALALQQVGHEIA